MVDCLAGEQPPCQARQVNSPRRSLEPALQGGTWQLDASMQQEKSAGLLQGGGGRRGGVFGVAWPAQAHASTPRPHTAPMESPPTHVDAEAQGNEEYDVVQSQVGAQAAAAVSLQLAVEGREDRPHGAVREEGAVWKEWVCDVHQLGLVVQHTGLLCVSRVHLQRDGW